MGGEESTPWGQETPVKVKEASPSNIELADHVGKYKVELGVMRKK